MDGVSPVAVEAGFHYLADRLRSAELLCAQAVANVARLQEMVEARDEVIRQLKAEEK